MAENSSRLLTDFRFAGFILAETTWKVLAALVLFWGKDSIADQVWAIMLAIVLVAGFVEVGFLLGQSSLDKFIKVAEIAAGAGHKIEMAGMTTTPPETPKVVVPVQEPPKVTPVDDIHAGS